MERSGRRGSVVSKGWIQAAALVDLFGFFVLGLLSYPVYIGQSPAPIPSNTLHAGHRKSKEAK